MSRRRALLLLRGASRKWLACVSVAPVTSGTLTLKSCCTLEAYTCRKVAAVRTVIAGMGCRRWCVIPWVNCGAIVLHNA